jgi:peptidoglycan/LPS O-acetylase OafA/YrhL
MIRRSEATQKEVRGASSRDPSLDIFRGLAIAEVVLHHLTAFGMRKTALGTLSHDFYALLNRTLHFAVPAFLFIMGVLLTRTMLGQSRSWREFYGRRARQTLVPYLVWTAIYALFRVVMVPHQNPPSYLVDPERWSFWLLWGKAWYHLYFMVLALQLYLVFPFVLLLLRRTRVGLGPLLVLGVAAQVAAHWLQGQWLRFPYPSTLLLWYVVPVLTGIWVGLYLDDWEKVWRRLRYVAIPLMVVGWAVYLPQGYRQIHGESVNSHVYHFSFWAYTIGVAFCLLALSRALARDEGWPARTLYSLGQQSIQIYLIHPMLLHVWSIAPHSGSTVSFHFTVLFAGFTVLSLSLLLSRLAARTGVGQFLFGRGDVTPWPGRYLPAYLRARPVVPRP